MHAIRGRLLRHSSGNSSFRPRGSRRAFCGRSLFVGWRFDSARYAGARCACGTWLAVTDQGVSYRARAGGPGGAHVRPGFVCTADSERIRHEAWELSRREMSDAWRTPARDAAAGSYPLSAGEGSACTTTAPLARWSARAMRLSASPMRPTPPRRQQALYAATRCRPKRG
jgi:hypothetical protein